MADNVDSEIANGFVGLSIEDNHEKDEQTLMLVGRGEFWRNKSFKFFDAEMVVYEILCKCGCIYYGETGNSFRVALGEIESKIRNNSIKKRRLVEHFGTCKYNFDDVFITMKDYEKCSSKRTQNKLMYINECPESKSLNTQRPRQRDINLHN
ncbi:hypothetical protein Bpfe_022289 [Biomphalaria pfeifferi]|uniref:Uncharacterized protein n=1 Tax=Biomphalaria pfeifferi TaxID=112525 RepID=A0AAD8F1J9_BIOPF|nr:hypothetical protein Bpfe_022289 [Biomphalaria pfeifferi]